MFPPSYVKATRRGDSPVLSTPPAATASLYLHTDPTDLGQKE